VEVEAAISAESAAAPCTSDPVEVAEVAAALAIEAR
jgi:hypothetical protein